MKIKIYHPKLYLDYTLHPKLFEFTFYILNYDICYTSHPEINFAINLDENPSFMVQSVMGSIV